VNDKQIAELARELSQVEDQLNALGVKLDLAKREARDQAKQLRERARHLLALISGREGEQLELPVPAQVEAPLGSGWLALISADDELLAYHRGSVADGKQGAVCNEEPPEGSRWERHPDEQLLEDVKCQACAAVEVEAKGARCSAVDKKGKACTSSGRFAGKAGPVCATHRNSEARAKKKPTLPPSVDCLVPGCGRRGVSMDGFCDDHFMRLRDEERESLAARAKAVA
jgi:hypothetical protein